MESDVMRGCMQKHAAITSVRETQWVCFYRFIARVLRLKLKCILTFALVPLWDGERTNNEEQIEPLHLFFFFFLNDVDLVCEFKYIECVSADRELLPDVAIKPLFHVNPAPAPLCLRHFQLSLTWKLSADSCFYLLQTFFLLRLRLYPACWR